VGLRRRARAPAEAHDYISRSDARPGDLAAIAAKNACNGSLNPIAQHRARLSVEEVLGARMIVDPLTRPMCSSIGDGAAAVVLTRSERASAGSVRVLACEIGAAKAGDDGGTVARTARAAYERAGLGPQDLDFCEVHDAAASAELVIAEELGLAAPGGAAVLVREGATQIDGRVPINPSGGGDRQIEGALIGLAESAGGSLGNGPAACVVTILGRGD
jgi:acetyl-CoA acetyltransferase